MRSKIIASLLWKLLERVGTQGIQFIMSIVLARLLLPEIYGKIALVTVFITLSQVFVQSGLGTALIQKKEIDNVDFSSVFFVSLGLAGVLYSLLFIFAPYISRFYHEAELIPTLRVLGLILFFGAVNGIQNAWVSRHMMFKELFKRSIGAIIISGTAGIVAAYAGLGIWALVIQQLTNQTTITVIMWFTIKWRPICAFSIKRLKTLFSFGYKLLLSSLIDHLYRDLSTLIIGRLFSSSMLGFYNRGQQFPKLIVTNIISSIQAVMLPVLSAHQDDKKKVKALMRRAIVTSSFLLFPMLASLAAIAEPMVRIVLTERWLPAVPFIHVFCFSYAFWPIHTANLQAVNALGRSDIFLKLEVMKKILGITILAISVPMGVYAIAIGGAIESIMSSFINASPNKRLLDYGYMEQVKDILPSFALALLMGAAVYAVDFLPVNDWQTLLIQMPLGALIYVGAAKAVRIEAFSYVLSTFGELFRHKTKQNNQTKAVAEEEKS